MALGTALKDKPADEIMAIMGHMLAKQVQIRGLQNIPYDGPALIVADHPTGIADGIVSNYLICQRRNDAYFFANSDILRVLPQLSDCITPLEWRVDRRSYTKTRETMECVRTATDAGRFGIIFPSGRLAKRHGLKLYERPWMASAAMFAKKNSNCMSFWSTSKPEIPRSFIFLTPSIPPCGM
ncbi:1-acyl-sn-glycerol-3-phosphate acyltransferase [Cognatiyoonia sp.]|uniref:1-acyl-sn-glycerol-3-phosphate acyltransferase n=1 Tax=Cognatiyoonia sp. TaxID=2211652 RepID=UPI003F696FA4